MTRESVVTAAPLAATSNRRPDIQGLRAVAVGLVMVYHAGIPLPGGFIGVDVFFVVSGFVITALLMREYERAGGISFVRFYTRRVRRLLPALAVMTSVTVVAAWAILPLRSQSVTAATGIAASFFLANVEIMRSTGGYFDPTADENALLHTWSLAVEEQFYLVFPALLLLGWRFTTKRRSGHSPVGVVATVLGLSFAASWALSSGRTLPGLTNPEELAFYAAPTRAWQFASGSLLALGWARVAAMRAGLPAPVPAAVTWVGAGLVALGALRVDGSHYPGLAALIPTVGTVMLLVAADADPSPLGSLLRSKRAVFVGDLSYSLYLWHWPVLLLGNALIPEPRVLTSVLLVGGSVVPAYLSYRWVEEPIRKADWLTGRRLLELVGVCLLVPASLSTLLWWGSSNAWWNPGLKAWESARTERPASRAAGCHTQAATEAAPSLEDCMFGTGDRGTILVVGDSHAASLGDSVIAAAQGTGYRVAIHTTNGCPFLTDASAWDIWDGAQATDVCKLGLQREWELVDSLKPALVVIVNSSSIYVRESSTYSNEALAAARWGEAVEATLATLAERGTPTLLVHEVPEHPKSLAACTRSWGTDPSCVNSPLNYAESRRAKSVQAERSAIRASPGAFSWDPANVLCKDALCYREGAGSPLYLDRGHLNPSAARLLSESLREALVAGIRAGQP